MSKGMKYDYGLIASLLVTTEVLETVFGQTSTIAKYGTIVSVFDRYEVLDANEVASYAPWNV